MNDLQREVDRIVMEFGGYWKPFEMLAALMEEIGELADELLKVEGVKGSGDRGRLKEELGDVAFALSCIANYYDVDLTEALRETIEKYRERDRDRWNNV